MFIYGLLTLIPLVGLFVYVLKWKLKARRALGNERIINQLTADYSPQKYFFKIIAIIIAIVLLLLAAANLRKPIVEKGSTGLGIDVMIALDVSRSMLAQDEKPSRLDKAKQFIVQLTTQLQNNRVGLVVFAGRAYLQMPLTGDIAATNIFVSNANPDLISWQGTVIGDALKLCNNSLDTKEKKYKAAILITDGEDHDTKAIDVAKDLAEKGVIVHTIGVGSIEGSPISETDVNEYKKDINGKAIISKLNEKLLQQIAISTGGSYHYLDNTTTVSNDLSDIINSMEKKAILNPGGYTNYDCYYFIFIAIAIVLLIVEFFVTEKKRLNNVGLAKHAVVMIGLLLISPSLFSQNNNDKGIAKGNELYRTGDFKGASDAYLTVLKGDDKNTAATFNNANSLFRQQQYAEAAKQWEALTTLSSEPQLQAKAWYNKGVAEAKQQQNEQAIASFKKSLMLNNNDEATRENLQMALNELNKQKPNKPSPNNQPPPPQQNKQQPSKKQAEQQLNMLREEEKRLQKEVQQKKFRQDMGEEKDW